MNQHLINQMNEFAEEIKIRDAEIEALSAPIIDTLKRIDVLKEQKRILHEGMKTIATAIIKEVDNN